MKLISALAVLVTALLSSTGFAQAWQQTNGPGWASVKSIATNSQGDFFVASNTLHRSTDNGTSWTRIAPGISNIVDLKVKQTGALFLITQDDHNSFSLRRSTDNGNTWQWLRSDLWQSSLSIIGDGSIFIVVSYQSQVMKSSDNGNTWKIDSLNVIGTPQNFWSDRAGNLFLQPISIFIVQRIMVRIGLK